MNALGDPFDLPRPRDIFSAAFLDDIKRLRVLATEGVPGGFEDDEEEELEEQEELAIDTDEELVRLKKLYFPPTDEELDGEENGQSPRYDEEEEEDDDEDQEAAAEEEEAKEAHLEQFRKLIRRKLRRKAIAEKLNTPGRIKSGLSRANLQEYGLMFRSKECVAESRLVDVLQSEYLRQAFFSQKKAVEDPDLEWGEEKSSSGRSSALFGSGSPVSGSNGSAVLPASIASRERNASILDILQGTTASMSSASSPLSFPHPPHRVSSMVGGGSTRFPPLARGLSVTTPIAEGAGGGGGGGGGVPTSFPPLPWRHGGPEVGPPSDGLQEPPFSAAIRRESDERNRAGKPRRRSGGRRRSSPGDGLSISTNSTTAAAIPLTDETPYGADIAGREEGGDGGRSRLPNRPPSVDTRFSPTLAAPPDKALLTVHWKPSKRSSYSAYPLHWAVMGRSHRTIRYLIKNGADPELSVVCGLLPKQIAEANGLHETLHVLEMSIKEYKEMLQKDDEAKKKIESDLEQLKAAKERRKMERVQRIMTRREQAANEGEEEEEGEWE